MSAPVAPPSGGSIDNAAFFRAPAAPRPSRDWEWLLDLPARPARFGFAILILGVFGSFFAGVGFVQQLVVIAPVFEELWKLGAALLLVAALRARSPGLRVILALLPGAGFGVFEHHFAYPEEDAATYLDRVFFHAGATALSMASWCALEALQWKRYRWLSTTLATVLHAINNAYALVLSLLFMAGALLEGIDPEEAELPLGALALPVMLAAAAHVLAWAIVLRPQRFRNVVLRLAPASAFR